MQKSISLRAFPADMSTLQRVELARAAGFAGVEVNLEPAEEYTLDSTAAQLQALRAEIEARAMLVSSVYCREQWRNPITSQDAERRARGMQIIERLAWSAQHLGTDAVLVVPGAVDNRIFTEAYEIVPYDVAWHNAQECMASVLARVAERYPAQLLVENVWNKFLLSPLEMARFVDELDSPLAGIYFDVGNILRTGFPEHWIEILGARIKRVHFKDFRLAVDNLRGFVGLLEGDVNWPAVMQALRRIGYDAWVTAEVLPAYRYHGDQLVHECSMKMDAILRG